MPSGSGSTVQLISESGEEDLSVSAKRRKCLFDSDSDSDGGEFSSQVQVIYYA